MMELQFSTKKNTTISVVTHTLIAKGETYLDYLNLNWSNMLPNCIEWMKQLNLQSMADDFSWFFFRNFGTLERLNLETPSPPPSVDLSSSLFPGIFLFQGQVRNWCNKPSGIQNTYL